MYLHSLQHYPFTHVASASPATFPCGENTLSPIRLDVVGVKMMTVIVEEESNMRQTPVVLF